MKAEYIGLIGATGRVGRACLRYLSETLPQPVLAGGRRAPEGDFPASFQPVDVFDAADLSLFCRRCFLVINCAGPASSVRERVALAALEHGCHYVDPGGYTPLYELLQPHQGEMNRKRLSFLLTLGILPGLSEIFPVHVARSAFDRVESFTCASVGRDTWTFPSAWDIAWGIGNIGRGEAPVYYQDGVRRLAGLLSSGQNMDFPAPVGRHMVFRLMRDDLQAFVEAEGIPEVHVYGNNWGHWVVFATVLVRLLRLYTTERRLETAARLIMRAAALDMRGKKPGFMLHLHMRGLKDNRPLHLVRTLFLEDTYRATGICAAIGARLVVEGMEAGVYRAAQLPRPDIFMERLREQGYAVSGSEIAGESTGTGERA